MPTTETTPPRFDDTRDIPGLGRIRILPRPGGVAIVHDGDDVKLSERALWGGRFQLVGEGGKVFEARLLPSETRTLPDLVIGDEVIHFGVPAPVRSRRSRALEWAASLCSGVALAVILEVNALLQFFASDGPRLAFKLVCLVSVALIFRSGSRAGEVGMERLREFTRFALIGLGFAIGHIVAERIPALAVP